MRARINIALLYVLAFVCSVAPALIYFLVNHDRYIRTVPEKIKVSIGMIALGIIVIIKLAGKLKANSRIAVFGTVFLLCYLLESILNDLMIFSFLALVGEILDFIVMIFVRKLKRDLFIREAAGATADANERMLDRVIERFSGRT